MSPSLKMCDSRSDCVACNVHRIASLLPSEIHICRARTNLYVGFVGAWPEFHDEYPLAPNLSIGGAVQFLAQCEMAILRSSPLPGQKFFPLASSRTAAHKQSTVR